MEWFENLRSVKDLSQLLLFLDLWDLKQGDISSTYEKLCELLYVDFDQDAFDQITIAYPELFEDTDEVLVSAIMIDLCFFLCFTLSKC